MRTVPTLLLPSLVTIIGIFCLLQLVPDATQKRLGMYAASEAFLEQQRNEQASNLVANSTAILDFLQLKSLDTGFPVIDRVTKDVLLTISRSIVCLLISMVSLVLLFPLAYRFQAILSGVCLIPSFVYAALILALIGNAQIHFGESFLQILAAFIPISLGMCSAVVAFFKEDEKQEYSLFYANLGLKTTNIFRDRLGRTFRFLVGDLPKWLSACFLALLIPEAIIYSGGIGETIFRAAITSDTPTILLSTFLIGLFVSSTRVLGLLVTKR